MKKYFAGQFQLYSMNGPCV